MKGLFRRILRGLRTKPLPETYEAIRPAIVAFISRAVPGVRGQLPALPKVIGTGFIVDSRGVVATNRHVVELLAGLPSHPRTGKTSAAAWLFVDIQTSADGEERIYHQHFADVNLAHGLDHFSYPGVPWYGEAVPDLAFVQINVRDVPAVDLTTEPDIIKTGISVATAGYPLGSDALAPGGRLMQVTPTLRHGIVSSLHPAPMPNPQGFTIDAPIQSGASGSPVFLMNEPKVIGMIYANMPDHDAPDGGIESTNLTFALTSKLTKQALDYFLDAIDLDLSDVPTFDSVKEAEGKSELTWETFPDPGQDS